MFPQSSFCANFDAVDFVLRRENAARPALCRGATAAGCSSRWIFSPAATRRLSWRALTIRAPSDSEGARRRDRRRRRHGQRLRRQRAIQPGLPNRSSQLEMMPKLPDARSRRRTRGRSGRACARSDYGQEEAVAVFGHDPRIYRAYGQVNRARREGQSLRCDDCEGGMA